MPFVACPELLCLDRERHLHDNLEYPDFFGLKALEKEPVGVVSLDSLKKRASRLHRLKSFSVSIAVLGPCELREALTTLLRRAAERLGPPDKQSDFGDPAFMAAHALNRLDPHNWREVSVPQTDGTQRAAHEYVPPETERQHLAALQDAAQDKWADANMQTAIIAGPGKLRPARHPSLRRRRLSGRTA